MSYEQRYEVAVGKTRLPFVRRPVETAPPDMTVALVDYGTRERIESQSGGIFRDGEWRSAHNRKLKRQPTHWTEYLGGADGR